MFELTFSIVNVVNFSLLLQNILGGVWNIIYNRKTILLYVPHILLCTTMHVYVQSNTFQENMNHIAEINDAINSIA